MLSLDHAVNQYQVQQVPENIEISVPKMNENGVQELSSGELSNDIIGMYRTDSSNKDLVSSAPETTRSNDNTKAVVKYDKENRRKDRDSVSLSPNTTDSCSIFNTVINANSSSPVNPLSTSDAISPFPVISFSPTDKSGSVNSFKLQKVIEELVESEESYKTSMITLLNYYIEPLVIENRAEVGQPVRLIKVFLRYLIANHSSLKSELNYAISTIPDVETLAVQVAKSVSELAVDVYLYEEYCNIYEDVLKLVKDNMLYEPKKLIINQEWIKGWENYLEATQPTSRHMDLSFISLIQKPISRIGKYRLIIESLLKYVSDSSFKEVNTCLIKLREKLDAVNTKTGNFKQIDTNSKLNSLIDLDNVSYEFKISSNFFGRPFLIGSLVGIWIEENVKKVCVLGVCLFKSHILFCDLSCKKTKKFPIKFIVSLSRCRMFKDSKEIEGGLYSNYPFLIKLLFEHNHCQFELLLISISKKEHDVWCNSLTTLINFVNGPYDMNFSNTMYTELFIYPDTMSPYDISLHRNSSYEKFRKICYFKETISVQVHLNFYKPQASDPSLDHKIFLAEYFNSINKSSYSDEEWVVVIKKSERLNAETAFSSIWSSELPFLFYEVNKPQLKKSSSWSSIRMGSFRSLKHSNSFTGTMKTNEYVVDQDSATSTKSSAFLNSENRDTINCPSSISLKHKETTTASEEASEEFKSPITSTAQELSRANSKSMMLRNAVMNLFQTSGSISYRTSNVEKE